MNITDMQNLVHESILLLDNMWAHHGDGSDLLVDNSELFDIVQNSVLKRLVTVNKMLAGQTIATDYTNNCTTCGLLKQRGSTCKQCDTINDRLESIVK